MRIAVLSPNRHKFSETFIHDQVNMLPGEVHYLYGGYLPTHASRDGGKTGQPLTHGSESAEEGLSRYLIDHQVKVVLAQFGPTGVESLAACQKAQVPMVVHFHGYDAFRDDMLASHSPRYPQLFTYAKGIIAVSTAMRQQLITLGCPPEKVHTIPCGVNTERFLETGPAHNQRVLFVGRFVEKKRPLTVLALFEAIKKHVPSAELTMIGDGPLRAKLEATIKSKALRPAVTLKGPLPHHAIAQEMQEARLLLLPATTTANRDSEGSPVTVLEAMATGLPVLATRHGGIPNLVREGETGFLVAENHPFDLVEPAVQLLTHFTEAQRLGTKGAEVVRERHEQSHLVTQLFQVITHSL